MVPIIEGRITVESDHHKGQITYNERGERSWSWAFWSIGGFWDTEHGGSPTPDDSDSAWSFDHALTDMTEAMDRADKTFVESLK